MNIISSLIVDEHVQTDGRSYIHEQHTDNMGNIHDLFYLLSPPSDKMVILAQHAVDLSIQLANEGGN